LELKRNGKGTDGEDEGQEDSQFRYSEVVELSLTFDTANGGLGRMLGRTEHSRPVRRLDVGHETALVALGHSDGRL